MAAPNTTLNSQSNRLMRPEARRPVFGADSTSSLQLAPRPQRPVRIAVIGNHLPRQCGIATFTTDLCNAIAAEYGAAQLSVVAVNDGHSTYSYPERVRFEISEGDLASYRAAADYLNASNVDLVCLQHEYGIFGGKSGNYIMELLKHLKMPVITTLHTVLREPNLDQRVVMHKIAARSERLIVMSQYSSRVLQEVFRVPAEKIDLIPHGIPDLPFEQPDIYKKRFSCQGKSVLLTFGLLSPNKGFESVIRAMPSILASHSNAVYMIAGATHPHVRAREGDRYRLELQALAKKLGVERQVCSSTGLSVLKRWLRWSARPTFTSRPTVMKRKLYREPWHMPWALGRPSSPLHTGTLQSCWTKDAECWCHLRTQPPSQQRQSHSWPTMRHAKRCANVPTYMLGLWSGSE
jgi:hypothetical protein